jgi:hypothetical protein
MSDDGTERPESYQVGEQVFKTVIRSAPREPLPDENRGSWYCPCAEPRHEGLVRYFMDEYGLERFYDLGAGDLRLSAALAEDYEVIAYETNELLAEYAYEQHGNPDIELRTTDYYGHWASMNGRNALFAAIGRTNELPDTPRNGIGLEGADEVRVIFGESFRPEWSQDTASDRSKGGDAQ